jgi:hypothetical protein
MLTKDQILAAQDCPRECVNVPEWGGDVYVCVMSGTDRDSFEASLVAARQLDVWNYRAQLAVRCITDESGARLFGDEDALALGKKNAAVLDRIGRVAQKLNKLGDKDLEDIKGN